MQIDQELVLRPLRKKEIALLPPGARPDDHRTRFYLQEGGTVLYLIAWLGSTAVGHLLLTWEGETREPMGSHLVRCPHLSDFNVLPEYRSHGIGTRMLEHIEQIVQERDYQQIGLGVGVNNLRARALYARHGYQDSGLGEYMASWSWIDEQGQEYLAIERCLYLVKALDRREQIGYNADRLNDSEIRKDV
jgi:GNAT superfamily N-acetyltransferase